MARETHDWSCNGNYRFSRTSRSQKNQLTDLPIVKVVVLMAMRSAISIANFKRKSNGLWSANELGVNRRVV